MINSDLDDLESVYSEQDNNRKLATTENNINELLLLTDDMDNTTLLHLWTFKTPTEKN